MTSMGTPALPCLSILSNAIELIIIFSESSGKDYLGPLPYLPILPILPNRLERLPKFIINYIIKILIYFAILLISKTF
jgi:hypothetical protein